jgi:hypothetical protein
LTYRVAPFRIRPKLVCIDAVRDHLDPVIRYAAIAEAFAVDAGCDEYSAGLSSGPAFVGSYKRPVYDS